MIEFEDVEIELDGTFKGRQYRAIQNRTVRVSLLGVLARNGSRIDSEYDIANPNADVYAIFEIKKKKKTPYYIAVKNGKYLDVLANSYDHHPHPKIKNWTPTIDTVISWNIVAAARKKTSNPTTLDKVMMDKLLEEQGG